MANGFGIPPGIEHIRELDQRCVFKVQIVTPRGSSVVPGFALRQLPHHSNVARATPGIDSKARRPARLEARDVAAHGPPRFAGMIRKRLRINLSP